MSDGADQRSAAMNGSATKCRPIGAYVYTPTHDELLAEIARLRDEVERLRLTDAEREAIEYLAGAVEAGLLATVPAALRLPVADTLRGLLARHGGER